MTRPFVVSHMLISMDGKVMGNYMKTPEESAIAPYYREITEGKVYTGQASLCGSQTAEDDMTFGAAPDLDPDAAPVPEGDFLAEHDFTKYNFVLDRTGRLGWQKNYFGGTDPEHIVSVLTENVSNEYKDFLRRKNISYLICGKDRIDFELLLEKMHDLMGIETLTVSGQHITWSMIRQGLVDEVSYVIVPIADGSSTYQTMFMAREGMSDDIPVIFELMDMEKLPGDGVWLRYKVKKVWDKQAFIDEIGIGRKEFEKEME